VFPKLCVRAGRLGLPTAGLTVHHAQDGVGAKVIAGLDHGGNKVGVARPGGVGRWNRGNRAWRMCTSPAQVGSLNRGTAEQRTSPQADPALLTTPPAGKIAPGLTRQWQGTWAMTCRCWS
jgi:hypothetical protein